MNPLLQTDYGTPHNTFPFPDITLQHIEEAILEGIRQEDEEIAAITANPAPPTFENTLVALSRSGLILERATTVMYNLLSAETNDDLAALAEKMSPILSEHSNNIMLNAELFARVKEVKLRYENVNENENENEALDDEDLMLLRKTFDNFERCGANLSDDKKKRFREIKTELSRLSLLFDQNRIKETNAFMLHLTDENDLAGLPQSQRDAAAQTAWEKGVDGWVFTLHAPSFGPFMTYSERADLRHQMYMAANTRCIHDNEYNNTEICRQIVNLRQELAQLLGYKTFAEYVLKHRMAQDTEHVDALLHQLTDRYLPAARQEMAALEEFAGKKLEAWETSFYSHRLKLRDYNVDAEMFRPYLPLDRVIEGVFGLATTLYGITFHENRSISVYHPDVKAYEVLDKDGSFLAVLYADFFPREGKQSGAWMTSYREQQTGVRPHVSVTMNFTKPIPATADADARPSLLTLGEVGTFLHEFGHALHGMFAYTKYAALSGTNVYWDFVELPSQFMENYLLQPEFLNTFARHYETGEAIPAELIERVRRAQNFQAAIACIRQVSFGVLDMSYYNRTTPFQGDIPQHEKAVWTPIQILPHVDDACMTVQFSHIMSGGYAAGYYSYKWAEVLDADVFEAFKERGMFSREVADDFRNKILSKGGICHPAVLYRSFRGREATIDALLRRDGIL